MIRIDLESAVPIEEQIRREIRQTIAHGEVAPGDELPSVRQLAGELSVHWNTVARSYRRLRDEGLLVVGRGRGVYVKARPTTGPTEAAEAAERVAKKVGEAVTEARLGGLTVETFRDLVERELRSWAEVVEG